MSYLNADTPRYLAQIMFLFLYTDAAITSA